MDIILLFLGFGFCIIGLIGSFLPVIPGITFSWLGLLLLYLTDYVPVNYWILGFTFLLTIIITIFDYVIPAQGTKKFGGSKYGVWGTNIGLILGLFFPPIGFIIGLFIGAFIGELINNLKNPKNALRAAFGAFLGFLVSSLMKFIVCLSFLILFITLFVSNYF